MLANTIQTSLSLELSCHNTEVGIQQKEYKKKKYKIEQILLPYTEYDLGDFPAISELFYEDSEKYLQAYYAAFFLKEPFNNSNKDHIKKFEKFKQQIQPLYQLVRMKEHKKNASWSEAYSFRPRKMQNGAIVDLPNGMNIYARLADESVFESQSGVFIVVGPKTSIPILGVVSENLTKVRKQSDLYISQDLIDRAYHVANKGTYHKTITVLAIRCNDLEEKDIRSVINQKMNAVNVDGSERKIAVMGGANLCAGLHYLLKKSVYSLRARIGQRFGEFINKGSLKDYTYCLGFTTSFGAGFDYRIKKDLLVGLESGVQLNQLKALVEDKSKVFCQNVYSSYIQANITLMTSKYTSVGTFFGSVLPTKFYIRKEQSSYFAHGVLSGTYAGFKISHYF